MKPLKNPTVHTASRAKAQVGEPLCSVGIFKMEKENPIKLKCALCCKLKDEHLFMRDADKKTGRYTRCKECVKKVKKALSNSYLELHNKKREELYFEYTGEEWRDMFGYEKEYQISNFGRICRKETGLRLKPFLSHGYHRVELCKNNIRIKHQVHRLVALTFIPNPNNYPMINHIDSCGINNHVSNLEWCDNSHNVKHAKAVAKTKPMDKAKNIEMFAKPMCVRATYIATGEVVVFENQKTASKETGVTEGNIIKVAIKKKR